MAEIIDINIAKAEQHYFINSFFQLNWYEDKIEKH